MVALYRKYRPLTFDDLVDQETVRRTLRNAVKLDKLSHAYLFCGPRGTGKTSTARILAKALLCDSPVDGNPCGSCAPCVGIAENSLVDLIEIDAASNRGIDEIRDIREKITFAPTVARRKVYIIDEVHMLTKDAFNALLKTLEEPPSHAFFILATTEAHKILDTIISRCQRYDFRRITTEAIVKRLSFIANEEGFSFEDASLQVIAEAAQGGLRDAIRSLEQLGTSGVTALVDVESFLGLAGGLHVKNLCTALEESRLHDALQIIEDLYSAGVQLREVTRQAMEYYRSAMKQAIFEKQSTKLGFYVRALEALQGAKEGFRNSVIPQLPLEIACTRIVHEGVGIATPMTVAAPTIPTASVNTPAQAKPAEKVAPVSPAPIASPTAVSAEKKSINSSPKASPSEDLQDILGTRKVKTPIEPLSVTEPNEASLSLGSVDLPQVQNQWKTLCNSISKSSVKYCLREGRPVEIDGNKITVLFSTAFSMEKVTEVANKDLVHTALKTVFGAPLELIPTLEHHSASSAISPVSTPMQTVSSETVRQTPSSSPSMDPLPEEPAEEVDVLSVFGDGEVL